MNDRPLVPNAMQTFYDSMASQYDKFYLNWEGTTHDEAKFLRDVFEKYGFDCTAQT